MCTSYYTLKHVLMQTMKMWRIFRYGSCQAIDSGYTNKYALIKEIVGVENFKKMKRKTPLEV